MYKLQTELLSDDTTFSVLAYLSNIYKAMLVGQQICLIVVLWIQHLHYPSVCVLFKGPGGLLADKARLAGSVC